MNLSNGVELFLPSCIIEVDIEQLIARESTSCLVNHGHIDLLRQALKSDSLTVRLLFFDIKEGKARLSDAGITDYDGLKWFIIGDNGGLNSADMWGLRNFGITKSTLLGRRHAKIGAFWGGTTNALDIPCNKHRLRCLKSSTIIVHVKVIDFILGLADLARCLTNVLSCAKGRGHRYSLIYFN